MNPSRTFYLIFLLWFEVLEIQWWNGYSAEACLNLYAQNYDCMCEQPGYDYNQYLQISYPSTYYQPVIYDYQYYYNPYQDDQQKPIVIIVNNEDHDDDWELFDIISLITSLQDKPNNEPVYIPYPVPVSSCNCDSDFEWDSDCYSDCGCRSKGKCNSCKNDRPCCDCDCNERNDQRKRGRSKSKSHSSGNGRSKSDRCRCDKYDTIRHRCDCCY